MSSIGEPSLVILLGATGVGKTALAIELALRLDGEIVGADSRQIFRHMDIGTAKPTQQQQALLPHHLIDIANPDENPGLAEYLDLARPCITAIQKRGRLPLLVGGSGQYISAIEEGWSIPRVPPDLELRAELEAWTETHSASALHDRLRSVDPVSAERIHPNNVRRVIRALEVHRLTGAPISQLQRKKRPPWRIFRIGLRQERETLYPRVDARMDRMIAAGFVAEAKWLLDQGYDRRFPAMSGLGYREMAAHLLDGMPLDEAAQRAKFSTHEFIRAQEVWFRGHDHGILWHNVATLDIDALTRELRTWIAAT